MKFLTLIFTLLLSGLVMAQEPVSPVSSEWLNVLLQIPMIIGQLVVALSALLAIFLIIPGEQPDKALQAIVDFLKKFSKK